LFHNATFFGSCIIHILHTGVLKFLNKFGGLRVKYINSTNIPPIMIINRIYEHQNFLLL